MNDQLTLDPVLRRFRAAVGRTCGERLERMVLFGSRARGDFRAACDDDVAVFIHGTGDVLDELWPLAALTTEILVETGAPISAKPFRAGSHEDQRPLMQEICRDGLDL